MGIGLSLSTVYEIARITVPTFGEALVGRVTRERCDERLASFGRRVVERARMQLEVVGRERVPEGRAFIYMSNHQSHIDIPVLYATVPTRTLRMVAKTELFKVPIWGQAMRASGMVEVNRSDRRQAVASLGRAGEAIQDGVSIWIAPEGTRSRTGAIGSLKKGGFRLAIETATPIVPVAISGTIDVLPPESRQMFFDVPVQVVFGAPIEVAGREVESLMEEVGAFFAEHVQESPAR